MFALVLVLFYFLVLVLSYTGTSTNFDTSLQPLPSSLLNNPLVLPSLDVYLLYFYKVNYIFFIKIKNSKNKKSLI